jgi:hypothetical protein
MRSITLLLLLCCTACSIGVADPAPAPRPAPSADLLSQIRAKIGAAACTDSAQCHTLALGARACGGPQSYLPWSSANTDGTALRALGQRFEQQQRAKIQASGELSDCRFIADPGAQCKAGTCRLLPAGPGAS